MRKILAVVFLLFLLPFFSFSDVLADGDFDTTVVSEYKISEEGKTTVTNTISITNKKSEKYPTSFVYTLSAQETENIKAFEAGRPLEVQKEEKETRTTLKIDFIDKTVGKDENKTFVLSYDASGLTQKSGEIWEVTIPKVENIKNYIDYKIHLSVPESFGEEAFLSPEPSEVKLQDGRYLYIFHKETLEKSGVTGGFGKFQVFNFKLKYFLKNEKKEKNRVKIAIPPDTSTQRLFYQNINPRPIGMSSDKDGNWIAEFDLSGEQSLDVLVDGIAQLFASPRSNFKPSFDNLEDYTSPSSFWQSDDPEIKRIAANLAGPSEIYEYVSETLQYDFSKIGQSLERLGASEVLKRPDDALCMEFTDLFIALARAKEIPAREINGYAYSQNPQLEPLSVVSDVLHAWPEYWDFDTKTWVPVDPTWGHTTQGVDFFNKFDLRHFAFVIHGSDPTFPYAPGFYKKGTDPQKDVEVTFGVLPDRKNPETALHYSFPQKFPLLTDWLTATLTNDGPTAMYGGALAFEIDGAAYHTEEIGQILPYQSVSYSIPIDYGFMGLSAPTEVKVLTDTTQVNATLRKNTILLNQLIAVSAIGILVFLLYFLIVRLLHFRRRLFG